MNIDAHCGQPGCICTHTDPCYRGFEDYRLGNGEEISVFCARCRPQQRRIVDESPDRATMQQRLRARAKHLQPYGGGG